MIAFVSQASLFFSSTLSSLPIANNAILAICGERGNKQHTLPHGHGLFPGVSLVLRFLRSTKTSRPLLIHFCPRSNTVWGFASLCQAGQTNAKTARTNGHEQKFPGSDHVNHLLCILENLDHHLLLGLWGCFAFGMSAWVNLVRSSGGQLRNSKRMQGRTIPFISKYRLSNS